MQIYWCCTCILSRVIRSCHVRFQVQLIASLVNNLDLVVLIFHSVYNVNKIKDIGKSTNMCMHLPYNMYNIANPQIFF